MGQRRAGADPGGGSRRKKGLSAGLREEIGEELEALLGRSTVEDLDLEAVEMAARRPSLGAAAECRHQRLLSPKCSLRGLLGTPSRAQGCMTHHFDVVQPTCPKHVK